MVRMHRLKITTSRSGHRDDYPAQSGAAHRCLRNPFEVPSTMHARALELAHERRPLVFTADFDDSGSPNCTWGSVATRTQPWKRPE